jgi:hypothetical protein
LPINGEKDTGEVEQLVLNNKQKADHSLGIKQGDVRASDIA